MRPTPGNIIVVGTPKIDLKKPMTFINAAVGFFMRIFINRYIGRENYRSFLLKNGLPESFVPTHSAIFYESWGVLKVSEALQKGATCHPFERAYQGDRLNRSFIMVPDQALTESEIKKLGRKCESDSLDPTPYDELNFLFHIIRIFFGDWLGRKDSRSLIRQFCIELTANQFNVIRPGTFDKPYQINPVEMLMNTSFKIYKIRENE
jgi:hypothetical protein